MMSATVAGDGAGCWAEASAMICSPRRSDRTVRYSITPSGPRRRAPGLIRRGWRASVADRTRWQVQVTDRADLPRAHVPQTWKARWGPSASLGLTLILSRRSAAARYEPSDRNHRDCVAG